MLERSASDPSTLWRGFRLESRAADKGGDFGIDFPNRLVWIDFDQDTWSNTVYLLGDYYDVLMKQGKPDHPICEFDTAARHIYVNWGHPVKLHMDDAAFLSPRSYCDLHTTPRQRTVTP